ncbi:glycoside hydrolase family 19 protein [Noviherbaspirillum saxi]|uniref:Glycoside hydrolase family 19 protein n=1 Tax=Noviherbaspirillum saxi TaxID=2320863 RepID=A0A3A3GA27_9BURK|nr:glycoside hydrolase family 19 protein [Noviherbaspirillum saxi]RJF99005.1 glycoside hydrolase family 19 protein [Noviherbaspirillum saxi]
MTQDDLIRIRPTVKPHLAAFFTPLCAAMQEFSVNTPARQAAFLSQILHETLGLSKLRENLNYSPEGLLRTFNTSKVTRFTKTDAYRYGRTAEHSADQQTIANIAYAGRYGNGPMESGDGWKFRGGGAGHLTFKSNYAKCGAALGIDLVSQPELIERPDIACRSFGWFWVEGNPAGRDLNFLADTGNIDAISKAVNGGTNGMTERRDIYARAIGVLI